MLRWIWRGQVAEGRSDESRRLTRALRSFVPVHLHCLTVQDGLDRPMVACDDMELMPALSLGDVLAEELDLDVPYDSLLLLMPARTPVRALSRSLGAAVAEALLLALAKGNIPVEQDTDSLYMLAHSAARHAASRQLQNRDLDPHEFCLGLADVLRDHWTRSGALAQAGLFAQPDFLWQPELRDHLRQLDSGFGGRDPLSIPGDLLQVGDATLTLSDWSRQLETALRSDTAPWKTKTTAGASARFNLR